MSPVLGEPVLHFHQVNSADQQNQKSKVSSGDQQNQKSKVSSADQQNQKSKVSSENFKGWLVSVISIVTLQVKMGMLELKWYP